MHWSASSLGLYMYPQGQLIHFIGNVGIPTGATCIIWYMYVWCGMCTCMYVNVYCTFVDTPSLGALIEQNMGVKMCICEEDGY